MTVQDDLAFAVRDVVQPILRAKSYKGTYPTWRFTSSLGDTALVNFRRSDVSSSQSLYFVVNLEVVSAATMTYLRSTWPKPPWKPAIGMGDWSERLHATVPNRRPGSEAWWMVDGPATARVSADDVAHQLTAQALPILDALLNRADLVSAVREHGRPAALALLLADEGPSGELDQLLSTLEEGRAAPFATWLRFRMSEGGPLATRTRT